jgi:hypothetical protein
MKATRMLRPSASSPLSVQGPVRQHRALLHALPDGDDRPLVDAGVLVRPLELDERVDVGAEVRDTSPSALSPPTRTMMRVASTVSTMPGRWQTTTAPESTARDQLHAGADERRLGRAAAPPGAAC